MLDLTFITHFIPKSGGDVLKAQNLGGDVLQLAVFSCLGRDTAGKCQLLNFELTSYSDSLSHFIIYGHILSIPAIIQKRSDAVQIQTVARKYNMRENWNCFYILRLGRYHF